MRIKLLSVVASVVALSAVLAAPSMAQAARLMVNGSQAAGHTWTMNAEMRIPYWSPQGPWCSMHLDGYVYKNSGTGEEPSSSVIVGGEFGSEEEFPEYGGACGTFYTYGPLFVTTNAYEGWDLKFHQSGQFELVGSNGQELEFVVERYQDSEGSSYLIETCPYTTKALVGETTLFGEGNLTGRSLEGTLTLGASETCYIGQNEVPMEMSNTYFFDKGEGGYSVYFE